MSFFATAEAVIQSPIDTDIAGVSAMPPRHLSRSKAGQESKRQAGGRRLTDVRK